MENTSLYIDAGTGITHGAKTDTWRLFDFFWMLHIMDYGERDDFNHALIIFAAAISSFIALSGFIMLFSAFSWQDLNLKQRLKARQISIQSRQGHVIQLSYFWYTRLLDVLKKRNINIRSTCGGGGSCGLCRVKLLSTAPITEADQRLLSKEELQQGYRLSCQAYLTDGLHVELPHKSLEKLS